jgi:hypothetical protein
MNTETEPQQEQSVIPSRPREIRVVNDSGPLSYLFDTARFEHLFRIAEAMALAPLIPDHLRASKQKEFSLAQIKGNCFRIVNQAIRWNVDPFAIVDETYVVGGKLAYTGKVVAAVINARAPIKERLKYSYSGTKGKDDYTITVSGTFEGESGPREVTLSVGEAKTENQMWRKDPEQKLVYSSVVRWARRFTPELMLGVVTEDDIERMDASRAESAKKARVVERPLFDQAPSAEEEAGQTKESTISAAAVIGGGGSQSRNQEEKTLPKREAKAKPAAKATAPAADLQQELYRALGAHHINTEEFVAGLKLTEFPGVPVELELLSELDDATCQAILDKGVSTVMESIRNAIWLKDMKER